MHICIFAVLAMVCANFRRDRSFAWRGVFEPGKTIHLFYQILGVWGKNDGQIGGGKDIMALVHHKLSELNL